MKLHCWCIWFTFRTCLPKVNVLYCSSDIKKLLCCGKVEQTYANLNVKHTYISFRKMWRALSKSRVVAQ
ncbi:unnamed protein product [Rotaria magnacalcarata]